MKKAIIFVGLLSTSTIINAGIGCGYLGVTIINNSNYDCVLRNVTINNAGNYALHAPPPIVAKGTTGPTFYAAQALDGVDVKVDYRCENRIVSFTSHQNLCFLSAGNIRGYAEITNDLSLQQESTIGSWLSSRPGQITWTIH